MNIIALGPNDWNGPWMNRQQLLSRLAVHHNIIYSAPLLTNWQINSDEWRGAGWFSKFELQVT